MPRSAMRSLSSTPAFAPALLGSRFLGFGAAQPHTVTTSTQLGALFGRTAQWIESRTGIRELRRLVPGESVVDLAGKAAEDAIAAAGLSGADIDMIIAATCSNMDAGNLLSEQVARRLAPTAGLLDLNAACSGFCYATSLADSLIRTGDARHVLIIGAEAMSSMLDPADLGTGIIFGDGAGAAVLGPADRDGDIGPVSWGSDGSNAAMIEFDETQFMRMQGPQVFRWAVEKIHHVARAACTNAGVDPTEIDVFVPHQANLRIVSAMADRLGMTHAVVSDDVSRSGNTSAASIPIALTRMIQNGTARTGQLALLVGFGAGLAYAAQVVRLP